jgi:tetratricopeptide (TPR) repeat protein
VLQALVSTVACLLVFAVGRRLFGAGRALAAAAIVALHGVLVFESAELLPGTLMLTLDLLALWLLARAGESRRVDTAFAAGLALGASAVCAPTVLPFAAVAAAWLRRPRAIAALALGVVLPIAPVALRNHAHGGEWVLVSSNGGLNFFIGNNADYERTFALRPGRHWEELTDEPRRAGATQAGAASAYFTRKGLAFVREHPAGAAALWARKLYLFFNGAEIPRDSDLYAARSQSWLLRAIVWPGPLRFPDGVIIPLALVGAVLVWRERRRWALLYAFLAVQALVGAAFFVTARHRVPALGVFALFAAAGAAELARKPRVIALAAALIVVLNLPTREAALSWAAEADFYRGVALLRERHDAAGAAEYFRRAAASDPDDARAWFELGNALDAARRHDEAIAAWRRAAAADPWDVRPLRRASMALVREGDLAGAIAAVETNVNSKLREDAVYAPDRLNLAFLRARAGDVERAVEELRAAARADPLYFRQHAPSLPRGEVADARFWQALDELLR